jgi:hypothetical protein
LLVRLALGAVCLLLLPGLHLRSARHHLPPITYSVVST